MKKLFKTIVSLTAVSAMLLSTSAFAHTVSTVTKYNSVADNASVVSTVSGVAAGDMITLIATTKVGDSYDINVDGEGNVTNAAYIDQKTATGTTVTFEYAVAGVTGAQYALVKSGSSAASATVATSAEYIEYGVTVNQYDMQGASVSDKITVTGLEDIQTTATADITFAPVSGYEIISISQNGALVEGFAITANAGDVFDVVVNATTGNAAVYLLEDVVLDDDTGYSEEAETISAIVAVTGTVDSCYFNFSNSSNEKLAINGTTDFYVNGEGAEPLTSGYYGVEIVGAAGEVAEYTTVAAKYSVGGSVLDAE